MARGKGEGKQRARHPTKEREGRPKNSFKIRTGSLTRQKGDYACSPHLRSLIVKKTVQGRGVEKKETTPIVGFTPKEKIRKQCGLGQKKKVP